MRKNLIYILIIVIVVIVGVFSYKSLTKKEETPSKITMPEETLSGKKVAILIAFRDFRDEEYFVPKEILEQAGVEVKTISNQKGMAIGDEGGEVEVDFLLSEINPADFDAIIFVGGPGCLENLDNEDSYRLIKETISQGKILASICISPVILAKAGALEGKKATVWSSSMNRESIRILEENGAIYQPDSVVVDGKIVTANGPAAAKEFAKIVVQLLTGE